jgi:hypothetical protein
VGVWVVGGGGGSTYSPAVWGGYTPQCRALAAAAGRAALLGKF